MTPQPWDWTTARQRIASWPPASAMVDQLLGDVRSHLHAAGVAHPDRQHAEAMWVGARCVIGQLAPILLDAAAGGRPTRAHIEAHINAVEDICCTARDLWPPSPTARLLGIVEQLRGDHDPQPLSDPAQDDRPTLPDGTWDQPYEPGPPVTPDPQPGKEP